eukprot:gene5831-6115_t
MRDLVTRCLQKDPLLRPSASQLLEHKFFKLARDEEYLAKHLLAGQPSLIDSVKEIEKGKAATWAQDNDKKMALSNVSLNEKTFFCFCFFLFFFSFPCFSLFVIFFGCRSQ